MAFVAESQTEPDERDAGGSYPRRGNDRFDGGSSRLRSTQAIGRGGEALPAAWS
jgi:hypothetical protein